jgi:hypothetical protein
MKFRVPGLAVVVLFFCQLRVPAGFLRRALGLVRFARIDLHKPCLILDELLSHVCLVL